MNRFCILALLAAGLIQGAIIGQIDTFEDGTTQGWTAGGGPVGGVPPNPPANIPTGGPAGLNDNYLQITSNGSSGAGGRLVALNALGQWAGDYAGLGLGVISMDLINLGQSDLEIRLYLENPIPGPPTDDAVTGSFFLPAGSGWMHATFDVSAAGLTVLNGSAANLLSNVTVLRIMHNAAAGFPPPQIAAVLGVDNIAAEVPEPSTMLLSMFGAGMLLLNRHRR
ncbi:MAG: PEP-CTERM sorting domain-containing protein [Acidobacteriota bacterium]